MGISQISKASYDVRNEIINTVLNYYLIPLKSNTSIKIKGFISNELNISMRDLCIISSNIIKNAADALEGCSDNTREIKVEVRQGESFVLMKVKNTIMGKNIILANGIPITNKSDSELHGFGIKNIISAVEKYDQCQRARNGELDVTSVVQVAEKLGEQKILSDGENNG